LKESFKTLLENSNSVYAETDMRAMYNPSRLQVIETATKKLIEKININNLYSFQTFISTSETNLGLAKTRNIGISHASGFITIFLDSDIILPSNYIKEHYLRHLLLPNALLMSFKENIDEEKFSIEEIKIGIQSSNKPNDSRLYKNLLGSTSGIHFNQNEQDTNILEETNYFKNFGYGRVIGNYDLPTMVIGHNFSIRTEMLKHVGEFNTSFKGWGLEDSYFGAQCISKNMWIIPVLSSNVYHLDHPPRSGSEEQKKLEFIKNLQVYKDLINKPSL
jgi:glycosyltransferase involved in cell wall biosynthesis